MIGTSQRQSRGFTLMEMLVVIVIIVIVATASVAYFGLFGDSEAVKGGATIVKQAFRQARMLAATERVIHWLEFEPGPEGKTMMIRRDENRNRTYEAADPYVEGQVIQLPQNVYFRRRPDWAGFTPDSFLRYPGGYSDVSFDSSTYNADNFPALNNFDLAIQHGPEGSGGPAYGFDVSPATGKISKAYYFANGP